VANPNFKKMGGEAPPKGKAGSDSSTINEKTADWPGLPGKAGPDRSQGVPKLKQSPKSEGI
jgi:hypothetical protein